LQIILELTVTLFTPLGSVDRIVKECERVNQKYSDPHFDIELDLKSGRRHYPRGLEHGRWAHAWPVSVHRDCPAARCILCPGTWIVKECERVNQKYSDPHFDIELDLKSGRRHYLDGTKNCGSSKISYMKMISKPQSDPPIADNSRTNGHSLRIVKECERVNQKYSDPHFDIELDLKSGRRHYLDGKVRVRVFLIHTLAFLDNTVDRLLTFPAGLLIRFDGLGSRPRGRQIV
jgi:hypothetical protein